MYGQLLFIKTPSIGVNIKHRKTFISILEFKEKLSRYNIIEL